MKPTRTQRSILTRMAAGHPIKVGLYGLWFIVSEHGHGSDTVSNPTRAVLERARWIELQADLREWRITEAGRQAIGVEAQPASPARDAAGEER